MNNKGFIATSLIYSFFLIFITLFLSIIADYLQNKVLLNTIEAGIKDNINNTKSIEDFDVGDIIIIENSSGIDFCNAHLTNKSMWIIANINYDNKITSSDESEMVLYNLKAEKSTLDTDNTVSVNNIKQDLENNSNYNGTRVEQLIRTSYEDYKLPISSGEKIISSNCSKIKLSDTGVIEVDNDTCSPTITATNYRERKPISLCNDMKVKVTPSEIGGFTITEAA